MQQSDPPTATVARLMDLARTGDQKAAADLVPVLYQELRHLAQRALQKERPGLTLQPTALVHEAYLRLVQGEVGWQGRAHFLGAAARAMRRILVEGARRRGRVRHGGELQRQDLSLELPAGNGTAPEDLLALDEALERLEAIDHRKSEVVHLRYFAGLTLEEVAQILGVALSTVKADWAFARAWLKRDLERGNTGGGPPR